MEVRSDTGATTETTSFYFPIVIVEAPVDGTLTDPGWDRVATHRARRGSDRRGRRSARRCLDRVQGEPVRRLVRLQFLRRASTRSTARRSPSTRSGARWSGPAPANKRGSLVLEAADSWTSDGSTLTVSGPAGSFTAARVGVGTGRLPPCRVSAQQHPGPRSAGRRHDPGCRRHLRTCRARQARRVRPGGRVRGQRDGSDARGHSRQAATVPLTPGDWMVRCAGWGDEFGSAEITVVPDASGSISASPTPSGLASGFRHAPRELHRWRSGGVDTAGCGAGGWGPCRRGRGRRIRRARPRSAG